eukprot:1253396-Pyramimonas_sp.AAC.1
MTWWTSRRIWAWRWMPSSRPRGVTRGSPPGHCSGMPPFHAAGSDLLFSASGGPYRPSGPLKNDPGCKTSPGEW